LPHLPRAGTLPAFEFGQYLLAIASGSFILNRPE
jgi:hypothetical protein